MLPGFSSLVPKTKKEAVDALASHQGAVPIAGGTDLMVRLRHGEAHPYVVDITAVPEFSWIDDADGRIRIGACATHAYVSRHNDIICSAYGLAVACGAVGSPQIRNMGTIGGNLVNASPAADSIPPLLVHDAQVILESAAGVRTETLEAIITAPYKTSIKDGELLTSILVEPLRGYEEGYRRVAKRAAWAISRLGVAWALLVEEGVFKDVRISIGSCTPIPFRARAVEAFLKGQKRERHVIDEAVKVTLEEIRRITGERPSFVYKMPVVRDLLIAALGGV